jgi:hypothetical protein
VTCDATLPAKVWPAKDPSAKLDYAVDFEAECARRWTKGTDIAIGTHIRVYSKTGAAGFDMVATTGGTTGGREPTFPQVVGSSVTDGSVVWQCQARSSSSLKATIVGTPTWTADTGVTVTSASITGTKASALIDGGTDGQDYTVTIQATLSSGSTPVVITVLPVRRARKVNE